MSQYEKLIEECM